MLLVLAAAGARAENVIWTGVLDAAPTSGTSTITWTTYERADRTRAPWKLWMLDWASNSDGIYQVTTDQIQGRLAWLVTDPDGGGTKPSDNYDVTVSIAGLDVLGGSGADRDDTNIEPLYAFGPGSGNEGNPLIIGEVTITVDNAGNAKGGLIYLAVEE